MITRIITGIVGICLAAFVIQQGGWVFSAAVLVLAVIGWHEYSRAFLHKGLSSAYGAGLLAVFLFWGCAWLGNADETRAVSMGILLLVLAKMVLFHKKFSVEQAAISLLGIFYVGYAFSHLILLRFWADGTVVNTAFGDMDFGCALIWTALIGTWASDTFAYFSGSFLGKHKLCPEISPKKTIEGFIGGLLGTVLAVLALGDFFSFSLLHMGVLGVFIALVATLGDLVESVIKRYTGIKDSGSLIPGHGGVLDRFDSVLFTVPFVYYYVQIFKIMG